MKSDDGWHFLLLLSCLLAVTVMAQAQTAVHDAFAGIRDDTVKVVDLTHAIDEHSPYWPAKAPGTPFRTSIAATYRHDGFFARNLEMPEHFGTHMDAPVHFDPKGENIDQIPLEKFLSPAVVIDVSAAVKSNGDYRVRALDVEKWIKLHGPIPQGALVLFRTGWDRRWPSQAKFMNADSEGVLHFPGLALAAARYLLDQAHPVGIGIDTASIDYGASKDFPVHHWTLSAGLYHLENVANLGQLPPKGFFVIALPLKLRGGSGSPARVLALIPRKSSFSD
jgi:kynurenine formamidase